MKKYTFELAIMEGNDEFWEEFADRSGCDEVEAEIVRALANVGFDVGDGVDLNLVRYERN